MSEARFEPLLTPLQAAEALGVSKDTLRALVDAGELRFIDVGRGLVRRNYSHAQFRDNLLEF